MRRRKCQWNCSVIHRWAQRYVELSGQIHAEATFPREKHLDLSVEQVAGLVLKKVWTLRRLWRTLVFIWNRSTGSSLSILWLSQTFHEYKRSASLEVTVWPQIFPTHRGTVDCANLTVPASSSKYPHSGQFYSNLDSRKRTKYLDRTVQLELNLRSILFTQLACRVLQDVMFRLLSTP